MTIHDLGFGYGDPAAGFRLEVPALDVASGASLAIVGPSGAGKTTLLHLVAGLREPGQGRIGLQDDAVPEASGGVCLVDLPDTVRRAVRLQYIGAVFQTFALLDYLSVEENILLPYRLGNALCLDAASRSRARELALQVGLGDKLGRRPDALSQGERQRVAMCRAVVTQPRLVLADEPTGHLDARTKDRVLDVLHEQVDALGATLLTVTHDEALLGRFDAVLRLDARGRATESVA